MVGNGWIWFPPESGWEQEQAHQGTEPSLSSNVFGQLSRTHGEIIGAVHAGPEVGLNYPCRSCLTQEKHEVVTFNKQH